MSMEASRAGSKLRLLGRPSDRAFEQLYTEHARAVYQYALAVLSNPADAEDVTQTTFLNAYRAFQRGERPQKPHNWLITIAHNVCRMRWRQAGSRPREVALEEAPEPVAHEHEKPDLDEVLTALAALSFNQRAALVMRELEGRSYQEIAEVLGLSTSAVEALLFRARRRLQLDRKSLGVLTGVPLPGSLGSFVGGGGGVVAAGGAALGADVVLKAAAVVVAGVATAAAGYKGVDIVTTSLSATRPQYAPGAASRELAAGNAAARPGAKRTVRPGKAPGTAPPANAPNQSSAASAPGVTPALSPVAGAASSVAGATNALPQLPQAPVPGVTSALPTVTTPPLPVTVPSVTTAPLPVTVPSVTTPQLPPPPTLPVSVPTVTTPQLPPPPPLPPLPPIPPK